MIPQQLSDIITHTQSRCLMQVKVFWVAIQSSVAVGYQRFGGPWCLHHQGEVKRGSKVLQNVGIRPQNYTATQPRRTWLESSPPWKPWTF